MKQISQEEYLKIIEDWKLEHKEEIEKGKVKKIFLENLPNINGFGINSNKKIIDWNKTKNIKVKGIFGNTDFEITIVDYEKNRKNHLTIVYNNEEFEIYTDVFKRCGLKNILKDIKIKPKFKHKIGERIVDGKRDITIIDRKYVLEKQKNKECKGGYTSTYKKYYKYKCNKCDFDCGEHWNAKDKEYKDELWMLEIQLSGKQKVGCSCCGGNNVVVENINSIYKTDPWMIPYIGEDIAKTHTYGSTDMIETVCPECKRKKPTKIAIFDIYVRHNIGCSCSDFLSYPEKFMYNILEQLNLDFQPQLTQTTFKWCDRYRYDFYFEYNNEKYIIETHGKQHYEEGFQRIKSKRKVTRTLKEEQANDKIKKELALVNGIKEENYIVIDCRKSNFEFIKQNILNSKLNNNFNLNGINWLKVKEFTTTNLVKTACELKRNNPDITCTDISKIIKVGIWATASYLKRGNELGWCHYDADEEQIKNNIKNGIKLGKRLSKPVEMFKEGISLGIFPSSMELSRQSEKLFGIKFNQSEISAVCLGKKLKYKGYTFNYISKEYYERRKLQEELKQVI